MTCIVPAYFEVLSLILSAIVDNPNDESLIAFPVDCALFAMK